MKKEYNLEEMIDKLETNRAYFPFPEYNADVIIGDLREGINYYYKLNIERKRYVQVTSYKSLRGYK